MKCAHATLQVALHGSSATNPAASHMCQQLRSMVVLRDPMDRIASHLQHVEVVLQQQMQPRCPSAKVEDPWTIPRELRYWADFAPAIFDNTILRHLLGRHAQCKRIRGRCASHGAERARGCRSCMGLRQAESNLACPNELPTLR